MLERYLKNILEAKVYDVAIKTPLEPARLLSLRLHNNIWLKREDLQPVFSFKLRGAYNKIAQLKDSEKSRGIIAASAGNHAQGVALAAQKLAIKATIVMPKTTPEIKINAVKSRNAKVILHGDNFDEAAEHAQKLVEKEGLTYIPPYDDPDVIAGQGTIGMEICQQYTSNIDAIFIPVGGGGLLAGIAAYVKYVRPKTKIIAVESEDSACLAAAMKAGRRVILPQVGIFADGVAVAQIGREPFRIAEATVDSVITVSTDEICAAIKDIFDETRVLAEPAGALAVAGIKKYITEQKVEGQTLVAINSGANVNFDRLRHIAERSELGEKREAIIAVTIPEKIGSFKTFCEILGKRNITEFNYRYDVSNPVNAQIFVGVQIGPNGDGRHQLLEHLTNNHYPVTDFTDNEMAKLHIRYMVGGRAANIENEIIYRFEFPERPGALLNFLNHLGQHWNISMFHYRNHGAAYGRVLVGMQVPKTEHRQLKQLLEKTGYAFFEETENPAYHLFLH